MKRCAFAMAFTVLLAGCAAQNPPATDNNIVLMQKPAAGSDYTFASWIENRRVRAVEARRPAHKALPPTLIFLSFSGGGARAAAVASGVLGVLEKETLTENIALISSTSGGSVPAAVYAARGSAGLAELETQFLAKDNMATLIPRMAARLLVPSANRTKDFAAYLDEQLFPHGAPLYRHLIARWDKAPFVILNATDMSGGRTFEFTQEAFSELCSDLTTFPVTRAVAASAAFPLLLHPLPLRNHWSHADCTAFRPGKTAAQELEEAQKYPEPFKSPARLERALYAYSLEHSYPGPSKTGIKPDRKVEFVHLLDGGLSDNLAARAVMRILGRHLKTLRDMGVSNLVLIQVNAKKTGPRTFDKSSALPSLLDVISSVTLNPIDVATELSAYASRLYIAELARTINLPLQEPNKISVFTMPVDFVLLDQNRRLRAQEIPTNWSLSGKEKEQDDLEFLKQVAKDLLMANPCFKLLRGESNEPCEYANLVQAPETPAGTLVAAAPAPAPAPAPPPPAASKVTYAADAFFDFDKSVLKPGGRAKLDDLVSKLKEMQLEVIVAVGHTDNVGTATYNRGLAMRRSEAVKAHLVSRGVERSRVYVQGKGETQPVADNNTEQGRAKNRRVEIEIVGIRAYR